MDTHWLQYYDPALQEVYRPDDKGLNPINVVKFENFYEAEEIAKLFIPHFDYLDFYSQWLHVRNVYQVLGRDLNTPSDFLLCYAEQRGNVVQGGTRTAVCVAKKFGVPAFNLWNREHLIKWCGKFGAPIPEEEKKFNDLSTLFG